MSSPWYRSRPRWASRTAPSPTCALALGGVGTKPWRARRAERSLLGQPAGASQLRRGRRPGAGRGQAETAERVQGRARAAGDRPGADDTDERRRAMSGVIGQAVSRIDGPAKVTGSAHYSGEIALPGLAYAEIVGAGVASGRITSIDTAQAERRRGRGRDPDSPQHAEGEQRAATAVPGWRPGTRRDVLPDAGRRGALCRPAGRDRGGRQSRAGSARRDAGAGQLRRDPVRYHNRPGPRRRLRTGENLRRPHAGADAARERRGRVRGRGPAHRRAVPVRGQPSQPDRGADHHGGLGW